MAWLNEPYDSILGTEWEFEVSYVHFLFLHVSCNMPACIWFIKLNLSYLNTSQFFGNLFIVTIQILVLLHDPVFLSIIYQRFVF